MARRGHALLVEGKIDRSALADYARDAFSTLAADIASCLADREKLSNDWDNLTRIDMDGIETIEEKRYQKVVREAIARLTCETKRLCGFKPTDVLGQLWLPENLKLSVVEKIIKKGRRVIASKGQLCINI